MVAGVYLQFNPAWLIFLILGFGVYGVGRIGGPALPAGGNESHWGSGHGIYFDRRDAWVSGQKSHDERDYGGRDGMYP
jgi:hypothetical protein